MQNNIGLVIWGCKGGHKVLCYSGVDVEEKSIADTIKDNVRSFVRFNVINLTTYALEFTDKYKVYTIYRSCNDSGLGAYMALTVYIPHSKKPANLREVLDKMMDDYFREYIHPAFGTHLDGKYDDIEPYKKMLSDVKLEEDTGNWEYRVSEQDDKPHLRLYNDISEVDAFFCSPYHKEFFACQEVMFMSREMYNKRPETLEFNFKENIIEKVSDPEKKAVLNFEDDARVKTIKINGNLVDKHIPSPVNPRDKIEIVVSKQYCKDLSISGTLIELKNKGELIETQKTITLAKNLPFEYKEYSFPCKISGGANCPDGIAYIKHSKTSRSVSVIDRKLTINGSELTDSWDVWINPFEGSESPYKLKEITPSKLVDQEEDCIQFDISEASFKIYKDSDVSDRLISFYPNGHGGKSIKIKTPKNGGSIKLWLRNSETTDKSKWKFKGENSETECKFESDALTLASKILRYEVVFGDAKDIIGNNWDFRIDAESRKKRGQISLQKDDCITKGKLSINGTECDFITKEKQIIPKCVIIKPSFDDEYEFKANGVSYDKRTGWQFLDPKGSHLDECSKLPSVEFDEKIYDVSVVNENNSSFVVYEVSKKGEAKKLKISGCKGFKIEPNSKKTINEDEFIIEKPQNERFDIKDKEDNVICKIHIDKKKYSKEERRDNEKNGFEISYDKYWCLVEYTKPTSLFVNFFKNRKFIFGVAVVILCCAMGFVAYFALVDTREKLLVVEFELNDEPDYGIKDEILSINLDSEQDIMSLDPESKNKIIIYKNDRQEKKDYVDVLNKQIDVKLSSESIDVLLKDYPEVRDFLMRPKHDGPKEMSIQIFSKLQEIIKTYKEHNLRGNHEKVKNILTNIYSAKDVNKIFIDKAIEYVLDTEWKLVGNDKQKLKGYVEKYQLCSDFETYKIAKSRLDSINKQAKDKEDYIKSLNNEADTYKKKLHKDDCTIYTVEEVENWWNTKSDEDKRLIKSKYDFPTAMRWYKNFFNAGKKDDINKVYGKKNEWIFSENQWGVIKEYNRSSISFTTHKRDYDGLQFAQPIKDGIHQ